MKEKVVQWGYRLTMAGLMMLVKDAQVTNAQESLKGGFRLPFSGRWALTGGPHGTFNNRVWNGLDFAPFDESVPCPGGRFKGQWEAKASASGTVSDVNRREGYAKIDHGELTTGYMHLVDIVVNQGQPVNGGDVIGRIGCIGRTNGGHLHWFIERAGSPVPIEGMRVGDKRIESFGNEYQGQLVDDDGTSILADVSRCDNVDRCGFRNDLTENYWELPVTGPGPEPAPRPTIEIPEIIIIPNTPTPEPTSTPVPEPTPREILPLELGCAINRREYHNIHQLSPDNLSFMKYDMAIEAYRQLLCSKQGSLESEEGRLLMGAYQLTAGYPSHMDIRWVSEVPIGEFGGEALYGVVSGQAETGEGGFGEAAVNGVVRRSIWAQFLERGGNILAVRPDYRYRVRVGARTPSMEHFALPDGEYSEWRINSRNPNEAVEILVDVKQDGSYNLVPVGFGERIIFPFSVAKRLHQLISTRTGDPGYSAHELLRCPPPRGCPP